MPRLVLPLLPVTLLLAFGSPDRTAGQAAPSVVRLDGRSLADADGPFLALGATLFWGLWGEAHDAARLDANLRWLSERGVDYVRVLAMVGGESWEDRRVDPAAPDYWAVVDRFLARLGRHRLRAHVTLFAGAQTVMPDRARRREFALRWADRAEREPGRILLLEVANEHYQNGLEDVAELRALGELVASRTRVLVALSAPADEGHACELYAGSAADVATIHYARDKGQGGWAAVRRPWTFPAAYETGCPGRLPVAINNEPIGPRSSVAADDDPLRLVLAYVTTFVSGNAAYVLHAGAGVRGGGRADLDRQRRADLFAVPNLAPALHGISAVRRHLPPELASWTRVAPEDDGFPFAGVPAAVERGDIVAAYGAVRGDGFVAVILGMARPLVLDSRRTATVSVIDPLTGVVTHSAALVPGGSLALQPRPEQSNGDGFIVIGR
jgi:hypothetical protein